MQTSEMLQKICVRNLVRKYCRGLTAERKVQVTTPGMQMWQFKQL